MCAHNKRYIMLFCRDMSAHHAGKCMPVRKCNRRITQSSRLFYKFFRMTRPAQKRKIAVSVKFNIGNGSRGGKRLFRRLAIPRMRPGFEMSKVRHSIKTKFSSFASFGSLRALRVKQKLTTRHKPSPYPENVRPVMRRPLLFHAKGAKGTEGREGRKNQTPSCPDSMHEPFGFAQFPEYPQPQAAGKLHFKIVSCGKK